MFELEKSFHFEAGHRLHHHDGKCATPHGHSYLLKISLRSKSLIPTGPKQSMVFDFQEISSIVKPMIEAFFDHKWLNETLVTESPTAEYLVKWIFEHLKPQMPLLYKVTLSETESSSASYFEE
jgi:6-pyruvoyltetrahydropterin/6-carboxytetrahydropterin synthase